MPGAKEEALSFVERVLAGAPSPGAWIDAGKGRRDLLVRNFSSRKSTSWRRGKSVLLPLRQGPLPRLPPLPQPKGKGRSSERIAPPGNLEVVCHNCGTRYAFTASEIG
jgi:hypothetical protein